MSDEELEAKENELAARELAKMPPITAEMIDTIREAVEQGLIPGPAFLEAADVEAGTPITVGSAKCIMATPSEDYLAYPCGVEGCPVHNKEIGDE